MVLAIAPLLLLLATPIAPSQQRDIGPVSVAIEETCDGVDNDGDAEVDEGLTRPCSSSCGTGVEICAAGLWLACSASPCCDTTIGEGHPETSLCPSAASAGLVICLEPGTYPVPEDCEVRASLVGTGAAADTVLTGNLRLRPGVGRLQRITLDGFLWSGLLVDMFDDRVLGGAQFDNFFGLSLANRMMVIAGSDFVGRVTTTLPTAVIGNRFSGDLFLADDPATIKVIVGNEISGATESGLGFARRIRPYIASNLIESSPAGIRGMHDSRGALIVANLLQDVGTGIDIDGDDDLIAPGHVIQRNLIEFTGAAGIVLRSQGALVEGNLARRLAATEPGSAFSVGIDVALPYGSSPTCTICETRIVSNTVTGADLGIRIEQDRPYNPVLVAGNVVAGNPGTGLLFCGGGCLGPALEPSVVERNLVFGSATPWSGIDDPTGLEGNLAADPLFVDPAHGDLRLGTCSPAVDAGPEASLQADLGGGPRSVDGNGDGLAVPDIGAWETVPAPGDPSHGTREVCDGIDNDCDGVADEGGVCVQEVVGLTIARTRPPGASAAIVTWTIGHEVDLRGYNLVEIDRHGQRTRLNTTLIACHECTSGEPASYSVTLPKHRSGKNLYLEMVRIGAAAETFGPASWAE